MRRRTLWAVWAGVVLGVVVALGGPGGTAHAHPLGNFTVGRYDGLVAGPGRLTVDHVEDLAEIPAAQAAPASVRRAAPPGHGSAAGTRPTMPVSPWRDGPRS